MWFGFFDERASSHTASTNVENRKQNKCESRPTYRLRGGFARRFHVSERRKILPTSDRATALRMSVECTCKNQWQGTIVQKQDNMKHYS